MNKASVDASRTWLEGSLMSRFGAMRFKQQAGGPLVYFPCSCWGAGYEVDSEQAVSAALAAKGGRWVTAQIVFALMLLQFAAYACCVWTYPAATGHQLFGGWATTLWMAQPLRNRIVARRRFPSSRLRLTHSDVALATPAHLRGWRLAGSIALTFALGAGMMALFYAIDAYTEPHAIAQARWQRRQVVTTQVMLVFALRAVFRAHYASIASEAAVRRLDTFKWWDYACAASFILLDLLGL